MKPEIILLIFISFLLLGSFVCLFYGYRCLRYLLRRVERLIPLIKEFDEFFYILSENNQMLKQLDKKYLVSAKYDFDDSWNENNPTICHALGEIDGKRFTECKESFLYHYSKGSRVFEVDFNLTSDGVPVVLHDWETFHYGEMSGKMKNGQDKAMTNAEFAQVKILGKYTPLTLQRFIQLANDYEDAWFIISAKSINQHYDDKVDIIFRELFTKSDAINPAIKRRYILHVYSSEFLHKAMEKYEFKSAIYRIAHTIHPQVLAEELTRYGINTVTTLDRWYASSEHCRILHENGIKIIVCIVQDGHNEIEKLLGNGVDMIMSPKGAACNKPVTNHKGWGAI